MNNPVLNINFGAVEFAQTVSCTMLSVSIGS